MIINDIFEKDYKELSVVNNIWRRNLEQAEAINL